MFGMQSRGVPGAVRKPNLRTCIMEIRKPTRPRLLEWVRPAGGTCELVVIVMEIGDGVGGAVRRIRLALHCAELTRSYAFVWDLGGTRIGKGHVIVTLLL